MAFPVPSHLPRKEKPVDISTRILTALGESTRKTLDVPAVSGWVAELEDSIQQTKTRIHDRIHEDRPAFERQLAASRSVQDRLRSLSSNVQELDDALSNPQTGLVPTLVSALTKHAALAQQASDARVAQKALAHLTQCRVSHRALCAHVAAGELAQAVERCAALEVLLGEAPAALQKADVFVDLRRQFRVVKDRTEEQLNDAYARAIVLTPSEMTIRSSVPVPSAQATISLPEILSSLTPASIASNLASLRRAIVAHWIEHPLSQPLSISASSSPEAHTLVATPAPPNDEHLPQRLQNLRTILSFLSEHLFSALPSPASASSTSTQQTSTFPRTLAQPLTSALLARLLTPSLPSTLSALPPFLELAHSAAAFEKGAVEGLLGGTSDGDVRRWVDGVAGHYERKRRVELLGRARNLVLSKADVGEAFRVEVVLQVAGSTGRDVVITTGTPDPAKEDEEDAWGLDVPPEKKEAADDGDGWGFDEEEQVSVSESKPAPTPVPSANGHASHQEQNQNHEEDTDAWGWDDDVPTDEPLPVDEPEPGPEPSTSTNGTHAHDAGSESDVWSSTTAADDQSTAETDTAWDDDPWADPPDKAPAAASTPSAPPPPPPPPEPIHSPVPAPPRRMTRLEKLAMKGKAGSMSSASPSPSPAASPAPPPLPSPPPAPAPAQKAPTPASASAPVKQQPAPLQKPHRPEPLLRAEKESYAVSGRANALLALAEEALSEAHALVASNMFPSSSGSGTGTGTGTGTGAVLRGVAPAVLDLFRALVPLSTAKGDGADGVMHAGKTMRIANDCLWIAGESHAYGRRRDGHAEGERMEESGRRVDDLGKWWFDQCIERQLDAMEETLAGAQRFADLADQDRFDQSEAAIMRVLRDVRSVGQQWKTTLTKTRYHAAIGALVEGVLVRVIEDVLELDDIPEVESHRLSELCKVFNALEGLFVDNPEQPSLVVAFVPSWLKYSYLSELLEASIADITYLFENGALVDFELEELVKLVRALFADTPLRTTTINKIHSGHPVQA